VLQAPAFPDVAVLSLQMSKTIVGQGYCVTLNVTVENQGSSTESFNLTFYANTSTAYFHTITLENGSSTAIIVVWNTTGFGFGNYVMSAHAEPLPNELDTADNNSTGGTIHVGILGDVNADGKVDIEDIGYVARRFMASPSDPMWNSNADFNGDNRIDKNDIDAAVKQFGQRI